jgi:hypothetical protein
VCGVLCLKLCLLLLNAQTIPDTWFLCMICWHA